MSWYRTYRPQTVSALHIDSVRESLQKMLQSGNLPQALLFSGPKGTGKTSSARIIAKVLNCEHNAKHEAGKPWKEPCNTCELCVLITKGSALNVVEMDGASNRRIDDIRALKERLYLPPSQGQKVVYIIDEVHMLTKEAFNALLKMLEEPPEHVVFIFATTDPQKIPETVISRATRVQFTKASVSELAKSLQEISKKEKIEVDQQSLELIAQSADGSFRDAVKLFEQLVSRAKADKSVINTQWVENVLSTVSSDGVVKLLQSILAKDEKAVVAYFQTIRSQNVEATVIHKQLLAFLHTELIKALTSSEEPFTRKEVLLYLLKQFSGVDIPQLHPFPLLPLELCAIEMVLKSKEKDRTGGANSNSVKNTKHEENAKLDKVESPPPSSRSAGKLQLDHQSGFHSSDFGGQSKLQVVSNKQDENNDTVSDAVTTFDISEDFAADDSLVSTESAAMKPEFNDATVEVIESTSNQADGSLVGQKWQELLKMIGKHNLSLEAILRSARFAKGELGRATINVFYSFHKEQLELQRYRNIVEQAIFELLGGRVQFEYILSQPQSSQASDDNVRGNVDKEFVSTIEDALL